MSPSGKWGQQTLVPCKGKSRGVESALGVLLASLWDSRQGGAAPVGIAPPRQLAEQEHACSAGLCRWDDTLHGGTKNPERSNPGWKHHSVAHAPASAAGRCSYGDGRELGLDRAASCLPCLLIQGRQGGTDHWGQAASLRKQKGCGKGGLVGVVAEGRDLGRKIWAGSAGSAGSGSPCMAAW